jgi:hypothetical protein
MRITWYVVAACGVLYGTGCVDKASKTNDNAQIASGRGATTSGSGVPSSGSGAVGGAASGTSGVGAVAASGAGGTLGSSGVGAASAGKSGGGGAGGAPIDAGSDENDAGEIMSMAGNAASGAGGVGAGGESGAVAGASGEAGASAAGMSAPNPALVAGTGKNCASYAMPSNGKCGTYYCGVDQATLTMAIDPMAVCGGDPDFTCNGNLVTSVGSCARMVKSANIAASNDTLRPLVQDCVYKDATIKAKVPPACLSCFVNAAVCAGDNCLLQCLSGDSPACDNCRKQNNCEQPVFSCGGLPSPF